jgi:hypothetical protein
LHLLIGSIPPGHRIIYCHEGPWHFNDRTWTIRADGSAPRLLHERTMNMEIEGHEFFAADGKSVWYDLQTPKSGVFWLAGVDLVTGYRTWYHLERIEWSVHFNCSPDGKLFAGDGGGPNSVAAFSMDRQRLDPPGNGQWIYLFRPVMTAGNSAPVMADGKMYGDDRDLIDVGYLKAKDWLIYLSTTISLSQILHLPQMVNGLYSGPTCTVPLIPMPLKLPGQSSLNSIHLCVKSSLASSFRNKLILI